MRAYSHATASMLPASAASAIPLPIASAIPQPPQRQQFDEAFDHPASPRCVPKSAYPWQHLRNRQTRRRACCRWLLGSPELSGVARPHCALLIREPVPHRGQIRTDTAASGQPRTTERPVEIAGLGIRLDVAAGCPRARIRARAAACGSAPSVVGNRECRKGRVSPRGDRRGDRRAATGRTDQRDLRGFPCRGRTVYGGSSWL
jgi:hypothetical protein